METFQVQIYVYTYNYFTCLWPSVSSKLKQQWITQNYIGTHIVISFCFQKSSEFSFICPFHNSYFEKKEKDCSCCCTSFSGFWFSFLYFDGQTMNDGQIQSFEARDLLFCIQSPLYINSCLCVKEYTNLGHFHNHQKGW